MSSDASGRRSAAVVETVVRHRVPLLLTVGGLAILAALLVITGTQPGGAPIHLPGVAAQAQAGVVPPVRTSPIDLSAVADDRNPPALGPTAPQGTDDQGVSLGTTSASGAPAATPTASASTPAAPAAAAPPPSQSPPGGIVAPLIVVTHPITVIVSAVAGLVPPITIPPIVVPLSSPTSPAAPSRSTNPPSRVLGSTQPAR